MEEKWQRGRQAIDESMSLLKVGERAQALNILDSAIAQAIEENRSTWVRTLSGVAEVVAHVLGDRIREISYRKQALPYCKDYRFAAYNFAQLLLRAGQFDLAQQYATEAYEQSSSSETEADRDLTTAILKQWPNISKSH
jgi:tetratricopeptide (TPR) repeat protein